MAEQGKQAKICSVCGLDCGSGQRTKDAKGNYVCAACIERAKTTKSALKAPPPAKPARAGASSADDAADNAFLLELGGKTQALEGGTPCTSCERILNKGDTVCLGCGYDTNAGRKVRTKIEAAPKAKGSAGAKKQNQIVIGVVVLLLIAGGVWYYLQNQS